MCETDVKIRIPSEVLETLRDAIAAARKKHPTLTIRSSVCRGVTLVIRELEIYLNDGRPFPPRTEEIPPGRRKKDDEMGAISVDALSRDFSE